MSEGEKEESRDGVEVPLEIASMRVYEWNTRRWWRFWQRRTRIRITIKPAATSEMLPTHTTNRPATESTGDSAAEDRTAPPPTAQSFPA